MTRTRWLLLGVLAIVAVTAVVLSRRGPAGITVDTVRATRQSRFVSTVTASGLTRAIQNTPFVSICAL